MSLTALERLDLLDTLDSLLEQAKTAKGLDLLDIGDQIDSTLVQLGYGPSDTANGTLPPAPTVSPAVAPPAASAPDIVTKFLTGQFNGQSDSDFINTLNELDQYVGIFLTLDDVKAGAITWISKRPAQSA